MTDRFSGLEFEVTPDHLELLCHAYVGWDDCEFGAPAIDCKRPYGNSDVHGDMLQILGIRGSFDKNGDLDAEMINRLDSLHRGTLTALQIALRIGQFAPGMYRRSTIYGNDWERV